VNTHIILYIVLFKHSTSYYSNIRVSYYNNTVLSPYSNF